MKEGWKTHAIGRHLVDIPESARLSESWTYDEDSLALLEEAGSSSFEKIVSLAESRLRNSPHRSRSSMLIERIQQADGAVTLVSWTNASSVLGCALDTYFLVGDQIIRYQNDVSLERKEIALAFIRHCSTRWLDIGASGAMGKVGFVVGGALLQDTMLNIESWRMLIHLAGKPDVLFRITAYVQRSVEPGLRNRAGGVLAGLLGAVAGFTQLRNRERPVGPIQADEILVAGTQDGKRTYGFKWEAPGKADSLAEPNLNISLQVGESAYRTNKESFAIDEEALELWDAVVGSIRLRPGAI